MTGIALFLFNDTATTEIYTLSLHDALPICSRGSRTAWARLAPTVRSGVSGLLAPGVFLRCDLGRKRVAERSEEHTSELQSRQDLVCRLLLDKKKTPISKLVSWPRKLLTYTR